MASELPDYYPTGVRTSDLIDDAGPLVRLAHEVDLDDLMLSLAKEHSDGWWGDMPTCLPGAYWSHEAAVGWYRKQPCNCGDSHTWDLAEVNLDQEPAKPHPGVFLGVYIR